MEPMKSAFVRAAWPLPMILALLALTSGGCDLFGQTVTVEGEVSVLASGPTDASGLPEAPKSLTRADASARAHLFNDRRVVATVRVLQGHYRFTGIAPGRYRVVSTLFGTPSDTSAELAVGPGRNRVPTPLLLADTGITVANAWPAQASAGVLARIGLSKARRVDWRVYNASGAIVRTLVKRDFPAGVHAVQWDLKSDAGTVVPKGWYVMILLKDSVAVSPGPGARPGASTDTPVGGQDPVEPLTWGRAHINVR